MKIVFLLALLGLVSCRNIFYREDLDDDDDEGYFRAYEIDDDEGDDHAYQLVRVNLLPISDDDDDDLPKPELRSSFWEKGSPLTPESRTSMVLPTAFEKVSLPEPRDGLSRSNLRSSFEPKGSKLSAAHHTSEVLDIAHEIIDLS